jgi:hypothetical protein
MGTLKSASVRNSGISRWRLISGRMGIFQDWSEVVGPWME